MAGGSTGATAFGAFAVCGATAKYRGVTTANPTIIPNGFNTSQMSGNVPAGGFILYQDGHVAWRKFSAMQIWLDWVPSQRHFWF